jgi:hypothetical protein
MTDEWENGAFGVDDLALYATRGGFVVPLSQVAKQYAKGLAIHPVVAAAQCGHASLDEIEEAFRYAINRARRTPPDWIATRARMIVVRKCWPTVADACRRAIAGEK